MVKAARKRAPSAELARKRLRKEASVRQSKAKAENAEASFRKSGGYGRPVVSPWDLPPGGIKSSPAYKKVIARCGGGPLPDPKDRDGAPLKGGFPVAKWPPNVLVDPQRAPWLPDDWGQAIKNTGPGGVYFGWVGPEGKFYYHRHGYGVGVSIEETLGRRLSALDGFNGVLRTVRRQVGVKSDAAFMRECLTPRERREVVGADSFHFAVISAKRANHDSGIHNIMVVEAHFRAVGLRPTWYVDAGSAEDYRKLGLHVVVGGKLCPARNMALDVARKRGKVCVQVSDDIRRWEYYDVEKQDLRGQTTFKKANASAKGSKTYVLSPLAAAQYLLAKMRADEGKPKLGGVFPNSNAAVAMGAEEYSHAHFILGDFFVADASPCRFDETLGLKEDYDYTCSHLERHGSVLRCNRLFIFARHRTNEGGACAARDPHGKAENRNIAILQRKWPGVFTPNRARKGFEVRMSWTKRCKRPTAPKLGVRGRVVKAIGKRRASPKKSAK